MHAALLLTALALPASAAPPLSSDPAVAAALAAAGLDCPRGVDFRELLEDLAAAPGDGARAVREAKTVTAVVLYQDCRAVVRRDEAACAALERLPHDLVGSGVLPVAAPQAVRQAANHCRTTFSMASLALGFPGFESACPKSWELEKPDAKTAAALCRSVKKGFPSARAACASVAAELPGFVPAEECVASMASFMGEPGACETSQDLLGDKTTCFWVRAARGVAAGARAARVAKASPGACREYAVASVARLCRAKDPRPALSALRSLESPAARAAVSALSELACPNAGAPCRAAASVPTDD